MMTARRSRSGESMKQPQASNTLGAAAANINTAELQMAEVKLCTTNFTHKVLVKDDLRRVHPLHPVAPWTV